MINRDFPNHDVKENVKAGWDFPNHELCHVIVQKQYPFDTGSLSRVPFKFKTLHEVNKIGQVLCHARDLNS